MAWTDKYIASFKDKSKDIITIQIQQDPLVGNEEPITLADEPLTIYVPPKDLDHQIWGLGCRINLVNLGALNKYDHIIEAAERDHRVIIRKGPAATAQANRTLIFKGFITPDIHSQQLKSKPEFSLTANNQISGLKTYYSDLLADTGDFSTIPLIDLIQDILDSTDMDLPIYIKNTLFSTLYAATYSIANVCYDKLRINRQIYVDQDEIMDGYSILEDILKVTYSRLYYMDGKWIIDRYTDIGNTTAYKTYPYPYTETPADTTLVHENFNLADEKMIGNSGNLDYQSGKKLFRLIIDFDRYDNLVDSSFMGIQNTVTIGALPKPPVGLWKTWTGIDVFNKSLTTEHMTSGLGHTIEGLELTADQYFNAPVTASFIIDFVSGFNWVISYMYDWSLLPPVTTRNYRGGFRLRYQDANNNWRFLTFIDGLVRLNSRFSDAINWDELDQHGQLRALSWSDPGSPSPTRWIIGKYPDLEWQSKTTWSAGTSPQYGTYEFESVTTSAEMTATINDKDVTEYSIIPGRPDWDIDHVDEDERMGGIYKYDSDHYTSVGQHVWRMIPLQAIYKITGEQAKDNPGQQITASLSWDDISSWIIYDLGYTPEQFEMYIDIMPMHRIDTPEEDNLWEPTLYERSWFGDVVVEQNSELSNNVIEGELNTDFRGELEKKLRIYDGDYVNYKNSLFLEDSSSKIVRSRDWKDANGNITDVKLQNALIHDLAQQYNTARHSIKVDLWLDNQSNTFVSLGSIFTYSTQLATKNFIVMGYDYNVKKNAYRITLREHKDYDEFTIV